MGASTLRKAGGMLANQMMRSQLAKANLHTTTANKFIFGGLMEKLVPNKPLLSDEAIAVGLEKHELKYENHPGAPLNTKHINETYTPQGKGTKQDPFIIPSHEKSRLCKVDLGDEDFDLPEFTVTLEGGGRCPVSGAHYKLDYHPEWAIIETHV